MSEQRTARANSLNVGLDFGTTNTVLATASQQGKAEAVSFKLNEQSIERFFTFRSAMCFWDDENDSVRDLRFEAGPWAIERFIDDPTDCRFIQSFKTFAASPSFSETYIHGRKFRFEDLLAAFLEKLCAHSGDALIRSPMNLVVGRPVNFAGHNANESLALERYQRGFEAAGFGTLTFVYEPVAAAYFFAQRLTKAATVLVADFGGGTSDFSIIRFEPENGKLNAIPLSHSGVAVAGDVFDYRILEHAVLPQLGYRAAYKSIGKTLEMPSYYHHLFAQWSQLALMKSPTVLRELRAYLRDAIEPRGLAAFIAIIENDLGYPLYKAVSDTKTALSNAPSADFTFHAHGIGYDLSLSAKVERGAFEQWIADDLRRIDAAVDEALADAAIDASEIDRVFLTGGSSFVPAVRAIFDQRFNPNAIETGDQLESIAYGLALIAALDEPGEWRAK
jgi:hypothetical chaperone protein